ncbi:MAG TPA: TolC family protein [Candidatus Coprenecus stercoripullorum]|nr:TolC family protein [Candidatus Coprenecus stercoripullorum]
MMRRILYVAAAACITVFSHAQDNTAEQVLASIERNNPRLKALYSSGEASKMEIRAENNWQQDLSFSYSPFFAPGVKGIASSEMVLSTGFDFPTQYVARHKSGKMRSDAIDRQYQLARRDILLQARLLCMDIVRLNQEKALLGRRLSNAEELLALMEKRFSEGDASIIEVNKVKMEMMDMKSAAVRNSAALETAMSGLSALNGGIPVDFDAVAYPAMEPVGDPEAFISETLESDMAVKSAEAALDAADGYVRLNRQNWLPKFEIGYRRNTALAEASHGFLIGASIPLFSNRNKTKIAEAERYAAGNMLNDTRMQAESALRSALGEIRQLQSALDVYDVQLMYGTLDALKKAVEGGMISVMDYYVEADGVYSSLLEYIDVENRYYRLMAEVRKNEL